MDNNLEKLRKSAHLTQHKLGKQLGLSQQVISRIERDISTITLEHLLLLADFYQVSIDYLLDRTKAKRSWEEQQVISEVLEEHYELVRALEMLDERDTGLVSVILRRQMVAMNAIPMIMPGISHQLQMPMAERSSTVIIAREKYAKLSTRKGIASGFIMTGKDG